MGLEDHARRPAESRVHVFGAVGPRVRRRQPEERVRAGEGFGEHVGVAVRALYDLDLVADGGREAGGVADDHADRGAGGQEAVEGRAADPAGGGGEDDHEGSWEKCWWEGDFVRASPVRWAHWSTGLRGLRPRCVL